ncbi:uncharacterized protein N7473_012625 [Penicillium subrubescens]|uniref:uncharacterized protein n=1 Tax=Penicillium subrubescens TaxID=1316194 RepID=UPI002544FCF0|nr:uncharacterized protein N7473_012625 [Penicillium subrubescens]KAJ5875278.1 hypothetical protein N7473_012625 [Penicillium subrubescens]
MNSLATFCLDHQAWLDGYSPYSDLMGEDWFTPEVEPDLEILLRTIETVKIPQGTMDQEECRNFRQRWQDTIRVDPSNIDAHIAILLTCLPKLSTLIVYTMEESFDSIEGFVGPVNLVEFHALKSLHINPRHLVGDCPGEWAEEDDPTTWVVNAPIPVYKRLPDCLEVLHIMAPKEQEEVKLVAQSVRDIIKIRLEAPPPSRDASALDIPTLQQEAKDAGMKLQKVKYTARYHEAWI